MWPPVYAISTVGIGSATDTLEEAGSGTITIQPNARRSTGTCMTNSYKFRGMPYTVLFTLYIVNVTSGMTCVRVCLQAVGVRSVRQYIVVPRMLCWRQQVNGKAALCMGQQ